MQRESPDCNTDLLSDPYFPTVDLPTPDFLFVFLWPVRPDGTCTCPKGAACKSAGKHPIDGHWVSDTFIPPKIRERKWRPFHEHGYAQGLETLRAYFQNPALEPNIGHMPYMGRVVGLDIDVKGKRVGYETLEELGLDLFATQPAPPIVRTPSTQLWRGQRISGCHVFFRGTRELQTRSKASAHKAGLELFTGVEGVTQLVRPPSRTGLGTYEWISGWAQDGSNLRPPPQILIDYLYGPQSTEAQDEAVVSTGRMPYTEVDLLSVPPIEELEIPEILCHEIREVVADGDRSDHIRHVALGLRGLTNVTPLQMVAILSCEEYGVSAKAQSERGAGPQALRSRAEWVWRYQVAGFAWTDDEKRSCEQRWRARLEGPRLVETLFESQSEPAAVPPEDPFVFDAQAGLALDVARTTDSTWTQQQRPNFLNGYTLAQDFLWITGSSEKPLCAFRRDGPYRGRLYPLTYLKSRVVESTTTVGREEEDSIKVFKGAAEEVDGITYAPGGGIIVPRHIRATERPTDPPFLQELYNVWPGYAHPDPGEQRLEGQAREVYEAIGVIVKGLTHTTPYDLDNARRERLWLDWHAYMLLNRDGPPGFVIVHCCRSEGLGRGTWARLWQRTLGRSNVVTLNNISGLLEGSFLGDVRQSMYVVVEEAGMTYKQKTEGLYDDFKTLVTADSVVVNRKYQSEYSIPHLTHYLLCTNNLNPLPTDIESRRVFYYYHPWNKAKVPETPCTLKAIETVRQAPDHVVAAALWAFMRPYVQYFHDNPAYAGVVQRLPTFLDDSDKMQQAQSLSTSDYTVATYHEDFVWAMGELKERGLECVTDSQLVELMGVSLAMNEGQRSVLNLDGDIRKETAAKFRLRIANEKRKRYLFEGCQNFGNRTLRWPISKMTIRYNVLTKTQMHANHTHEMADNVSVRRHLFGVEKLLIELGRKSIDVYDADAVINAAQAVGVDLSSYRTLIAPKI